MEEFLDDKVEKEYVKMSWRSIKLEELKKCRSSLAKMKEQVEKVLVTMRRVPRIRCWCIFERGW